CLVRVFYFLFCRVFFVFLFFCCVGFGVVGLVFFFFFFLYFFFFFFFCFFVFFGGFFWGFCWVVGGVFLPDWGVPAVVLLEPGLAAARPDTDRLVRVGRVLGG
ncbi:hypothetical protein PUR61_13505, partial [Streptomyces sp. BE20]|uniref:hypothetical protein n=1 Tax=Streptomyces sp. BE20 TaxID=3002525 RepID=UPI002E7A2C37